MRVIILDARSCTVQMIVTCSRTIRIIAEILHLIVRHFGHHSLVSRIFVGDLVQLLLDQNILLLEENDAIIGPVTHPVCVLSHLLASFNVPYGVL